jgi:small subunit ribosomal protein S7
MVSRLVNKIMLDGKKSTAEKIVYGALDVLEDRESQPAITVLQQAVRNATPQLQVKSRRIGGATYQVPSM